MIVGVGVDIVSLKRVEALSKKYSEKFENKICHPSEITSLPKKEDRKLRALASSFAAKEAFSKACGTGFSGGTWFTDLEVKRSESGAPQICAYGKMKDLVSKLAVQKTHLSISYENDLCIAMTILEK